ncbi:MAG: 1-acyl-sn-glycerol-3-phosphate acyltransferase [Clostridiales bacterium]|nr:1-acyl-sn-glycerol-3-phosphate acyltransferase [Clostridiales bacterium]
MNFWHKIPLFIWSLFYPCKIHGKENVPTTGASVLVCNHFRAIDCGFVARVYNKDVYFLAKKELFKNKLLGKIVTSFGAIPIDREKPDLKSLLKASKVLKDGHKLVIFPEGTRNKTNEVLQELKGGSAMFAVKAKCPIIPMMLSGRAKIFRRTHIIVGKPFELSEYYDKKITPEVTEEMDKILYQKMVEQGKILKEILNKKKKVKNVTDKG